jgi:hypothetical protein
VVALFKAILLKHLIETPGDLQERMSLAWMSFCPLPQDMRVEQESLAVSVGQSRR